VTHGDGKVTITNRRMKREAEDRKQANERQLRYARKKKGLNDGEDDGKDDAKMTPLSSSSSSSSSSFTKTPIGVSVDKPPPTSGAKPKKQAKSPPDERGKHWAIQTIRELTGYYPRKILWVEIIAALGDVADVPKLTECFRAWAKVSNNAANSVWFLDWYPNGIPAKQNGNGHNGRSVAEINTANAEEATRRTVERMRNGRNGS
jgi:hypothetical protein